MKLALCAAGVLAALLCSAFGARVNLHNKVAAGSVSKASADVDSTDLLSQTKEDVTSDEAEEALTEVDSKEDLLDEAKEDATLDGTEEEDATLNGTEEEDAILDGTEDADAELNNSGSLLSNASWDRYHHPAGYVYIHGGWHPRGWHPPRRQVHIRIGGGGRVHRRRSYARGRVHRRRGY